jgi:hypothetical protein
MRGPKKISELIEDVYDAALEPARWNDVVVGINDFVGGQACGVFSKDSISKFGVTHYYCGADPHYIQLYSDTHSKFDPLVHLPRFGQVVSIPDLVPFDEYRHGRFYQEWLQPQGCIDAANVVLEKSDSKCPVLLTVLSGKRMVDEAMRRQHRRRQRRLRARSDWLAYRGRPAARRHGHRQQQRLVHQTRSSPTAIASTSATAMC